MTQQSRIVIAGAGSIGCYVGGCLALGGRDVVLLARRHVVAAVRTGLKITDYEGRQRVVGPGALTATTDPAEALRDAGLVIITVKSGQTSEMAELAASLAPLSTPILSLQNGIQNVERIVAAAPGRTVLAGMVPFNVLQTGDSELRFHRGTDGAVIIAAGHDLAGLLATEGLPVEEASDMRPIMWGKLLLNLNNALNALSGLPLADQLSQRAWRMLLADQLDEAVATLNAAGIRPAALAGAPPWLLPTVLRLPDWLFRRVARRMLAVDAEARSSMWEDLERRRPTEIDEFQEAILRLGSAHDVAVPLTARIARLVREAEAAGNGSPTLSAQAVRG